MNSGNTTNPGNRPDDVRLRTPDRSQMAMELSCPEQLIPAEHPARVIWEVSGRLDLSSFYASIQARAGSVGRDATDPRLLAALWLYACTRGVGSARELDRLCRESAACRWLCGGVTLNYHTLADFRVEHGAALDELFTQVIATLVKQGLVKVRRISQDGLRVRGSAGADSFRRGQSLEKLLADARRHVQDLKALLEDPQRSAGLSAKERAAQTRAARERQQRIERALARLPELQEKQRKLARKVSEKDKAAGKLKEPRVSTTDADVRVMKMPDGGYRPAVNTQIATDTESRAIVGVDVVTEGVDTGQAEPMRAQVQRRTGQKVEEHLIDGGYLKLDDIERASDQGVDLYVPPKPPRNKQLRDSQYDPCPTDTPALAAWRARMGSAQGKTIYKQRAATSETVNADLKTHRALGELTVRGLEKIKRVMLWSALAYNLMHFGQALLQATADLST
jgi:transposase